MDKTTRVHEQRHPRAMHSQAAQRLHPRAAQRLRNAIITLLLLTAGALSAAAQETPNFTVNGVGYYDYNSYVAVVSYTGTAETLVIPASVTNGGSTYSVSRVNYGSSGSVTFSGVKNLTFEEGIYLYGTISLPNAETITFNGGTYLSGTISLPNAVTITFEKGVSFGSNPIQCPKLTTIYFKDSTPTLSGDGSNYFANGRIGSITAYVAGKTQEECDQMKATQAVWCEFKDVKPYAAPDEKVNIVVTNTTTAQGNPSFINTGGNVMTTAGTQTFQVDKYGNCQISVRPLSAASKITAVFLNGKDILSQMTKLSTQNVGFAYQYTLENVSAAYTYIQVMADDTRVKYDLTAEEGGKVKVGSGTASGGQQTFYVTKNNSETLTIIPDAGYELGEYWLNGVKEAMVAGDDGSCTKTVTGGGNIVVTFKRIPTIEFADDAVKQICVANWDTDGDGELSYEEAQSVTELGNATTVFQNNSTIETFDELQYFTGLTAIGARAFNNCTNLKSVTLPQTVTSIGLSAFAGCSSLESIRLPQALTEIVNYAFSGCSSLESIELPNSLESIGSSAFSSSGLKEIFIPASVQTVNESAFTSCANLKLIVFDEENPVYESGIYRNAIIVKETQKALHISTNNPIIPEGVRSFTSNGVWKGGGTVTQLVVPASVEQLGRAVFHRDLETLTVKWREPLTFHYLCFGSTSDIPENCQLIVPFGTRDAYIAAGWTETIFKGGVVEDESVLDVNGDGTVNMLDVRSVLDKHLN